MSHALQLHGQVVKLGTQKQRCPTQLLQTLHFRHPLTLWQPQHPCSELIP
ncbi:pentatricopeptide repeat-containing protein [Sesbania bispinosa]|nr:pentatricopeptide repeat-containing protein [Sesbania bispinosa]